MNRATQRVLVVEDEQHLADGLRFNLEAEGYAAEIVDWLKVLRPIEYEALTVAELGQRLRNARVTVADQLWRNGRNTAGVDLRKQDA